MNNKKCTSVADLIKPIKKRSHETSVNDLIKPKKKNLHKISETSVTELIKSKKKNSHKTSVTDLIKPRKKYLYPCNCVFCNGEEVDFRTQEKHTKDNSLWKLENTRKNQKNAIMVRKQKRSSINIHDADPAEVNLPKKRKRDSHYASSSNPDSFQPNNNKEGFQPNNDNEDDDIYVLSDSFRPDSVSSSKPSHFRIPAPTFGNDIIDQDENEDNEDEDNEDEDEDDEDNEDEDNEDEDEDDEASHFRIPAPTFGDDIIIDQDENEDNEDSEDEDNEDEDNEDEDEDDEDDEDEDDEADGIENLFASPEIDNDEIFIMKNLNDSMETEIILWAFKFQQRFRLPDIALEALIKFLHTLLTRLSKLQFKNFPKSLYTAKKMLNIFQPKMQLAVCSNCHKLHNIKNIVEYKEEGETAIANCLHEEFPNNPVSIHRNKCNKPLSILKKRKGGTIAVPRMLYPKPSIRQQLTMLYQRPDFENMLKLSGIQRGGNIYSDIYDGKIWKTFPFDGSTFFTPETAMTHLGLLFNLDWFQPFTYTQHSAGAIYASICNLPRSERNKPENIIYLGFLPGPKEVGLERINHYLAPIVDEFLELWNGWKVPKTYQCPDGLNIKVALIVGSCDTPATRKLFGHGAAAMKCHRCEKRSTYSADYRKNHYGGDHSYDEWITNLSDPSLHRQYAHEWLQCDSKSSRETHFKEHGVRWSELLRLPYMNPIRFAVVDPMHCLFLGIAKQIIKSIFIEQGKLSMEQLRVAQCRMDHVDLPSDIGRIPPKIAIGNDGFSKLTADQWKTFIMIFSTTILWDMLDDNDRKILGYFVRACNLLVSRLVTEDDLKEAQERLKDMSYLIERTYGPEFITSNIHLALHLPDCCRDYGPVYSFWLFPFERLNGYIGR